MSKRFSLALTLSVLSFALVASACAKEYWVAVDQPTSLTVVEINIEQDSFAPPTMRVAKGGAVAWTNLDERPHSVTASTGRFDVVLEPGETYVHTFNEYGSFDYSDRLGGGAAGTVSVNFGRVAVNR